ncbi:MAG: pimeloyl-ACP methyl ester carboxylesterase [Cryomorphaceae bacterium]|jgi:pimeloyl-ACP methyl ester carboxylesterase
MKLAFRQMGSGEPLIILHGLFGSSDNWQTLGKQFAEDFSVYLVDQRNHGKSPHSDEFNYDLLAQDLNQFMEEQGIDQATFIGHSMGGKAVMRFAQLFPSKVKKIAVADMGVKSYSPHHHDVLRAFHAIDADTLSSRSEAEERIEAVIPEFGVRQFLLKNLYRKKEGGYSLRVNFRVMESEMDRVLEALPSEQAEVNALFIRGLKSNYIPDSDFEQIRTIFPKAIFAELQAGHWLHAEDPQGFYTIVKDFVTK